MQLENFMGLKKIENQLTKPKHTCQGFPQTVLKLLWDGQKTYCHFLAKCETEQF